jgi:non-ribosomal peptide synthetase component F
MHHIISDGISLGIMAHDFMALYEGEELGYLRIQYKDYSEWQNRKEKKNALEKQEKYWLNELNGNLSLTNLPVDFPDSPGTIDFKGSNLEFVIQKEESLKLKSLAAERDVSLFMMLLAIFNVMLAKMCREKEIIIGIPIANREYSEMLFIIGAFANNLVLRNYPSGEKTFQEFLKEVREKTVKAFENQNYPFMELVDRLAKKNNIPGENPIFNVQFHLENFNIPSLKKSQLKLKARILQRSEAKTDLSLSAIDMKEKIMFSFNYKSNLFKKETIEKLARYFKNTAKAVVENPGQKLSQIEMVLDEQKQEIVSLYNMPLEEEWEE